jgi:hypothetical protein
VDDSELLSVKVFVSDNDFDIVNYSPTWMWMDGLACCIYNLWSYMSMLVFETCLC